MITLSSGSAPFTAVYQADGLEREEDFSVRDFPQAAEVLLAGVRPDETAVGVWHRHVFYHWAGRGAGVTGIGFISEPGKRRE